MFYDRPDCIKLADQVFVFKNFLNPKLMKSIVSEMDPIDKGTFLYSDTEVEWYYDKMTPVPTDLLDLWEQCSELIYPEYLIHPSNNLIALRPGDGGMFIHTDSPGRGCELMLTQPDVWSTCCIIDYGLVAYMGNFEGGEVFYPNLHPDGTVKSDQDQLIEGLPCLEYKPEPGDVILHSSVHPYNHGVREVTSGIRYAFSNFVVKYSEHPQSFYPYRTKEYYDILGDRTFENITNWMTPLYESETVKRIRKEKEEAKLKADLNS